MPPLQTEITNPRTSIENLMNFREIRPKEFKCRVEYDVQRNPSVKQPKRQKRLLTFILLKGDPDQIKYQK